MFKNRAPLKTSHAHVQLCFLKWASAQSSSTLSYGAFLCLYIECNAGKEACKATEFEKDLVAKRENGGIENEWMQLRKEVKINS